MSSHRKHPDNDRADDRTEFILYDDCDRCDEHARLLYTLDMTNLRILFGMAQVFQREGGAALRPYSTNEYKVLRQFETMLLIMHRLGLQRVPDIDPLDHLRR